jgi:hypothetical protein
MDAARAAGVPDVQLVGTFRQDTPMKMVLNVYCNPGLYTSFPEATTNHCTGDMDVGLSFARVS